MSCRRFPNRPESVRKARRFVVEQLASTGIDLFAAELLTSELATNAVQHAHTAFEVRVDWHDHHIRVEVVNGNSEMVVAIRTPDSQGGRGLKIVDSLASAWGSYDNPAAKVVWFELPASDAGAGPSLRHREPARRATE